MTTNIAVDRQDDLMTLVGNEIVTSDKLRSLRNNKNERIFVPTRRSSEGMHSSPPSTPGMETSVSCTTFNILAPIYKRIGHEGCRESQYHDAWFNRNERIIDMLLSKGSSIICLQEFWLGNEELVHLYEDKLGCAGYLPFKLARTSDRGDGLLTAIKDDRFTVLNYRELRFNDCGDRVAQFFHLRVKVPFYKRNQTGGQHLLLVNTHLLFPHNSSFCLVRLWQVYKIIECLEHFKVEHGLISVPIILCGDWNGSKRGHVYKFLRSQGFESCYDAVHRYTDNDHRWVSHRNHRGNVCGVDFIWLRNPGNHRQPLSSSWRDAVVGIIKAKLCEAGFPKKEVLCYIQPKQNGCKLPLYEFQRRLHQLGLTRKCSEGLTSEEIGELMQTLYVDANDLIDSTAEFEVVLPGVMSVACESVPWSSSFSTLKENVKLTSVDTSNALCQSKSFSEKAAALVIQDASLFPPEVEEGLWPEHYVLSDHAPLTAIFEPKRICDSMVAP